MLYSKKNGMNWETGVIFIGVLGCVLPVWYLYRRSQNDAAENTEEPIDNADAEYEDLLLTGLVLEEIYDDDNDSSDDMDSDGSDDGFDSGYDDSSE